MYVDTLTFRKVPQNGPDACFRVNHLDSILYFQPTSVTIHVYTTIQPPETKPHLSLYIHFEHKKTKDMEHFYEKLVAHLQSEYTTIRREKFVGACGQGGLEHQAMFYENSEDKTWKLACVWLDQQKKGSQLMIISYYPSS